MGDLSLTRIALPLFLLVALSAPAAGQECRPEQTVSGVVIEGCGESPCAERGELERLTGMTELLGEPWRPAAVEVARARLLQSGHFLEVESECLPSTPFEATVRFAVVPNQLLRRVALTATGTLFSSDLEQRLFLHTGAIFNPQAKESQERLERQTTSLLSYLRQEGFDRATVKSEVVEVGTGLVDIRLAVDEGRVSRVERVEVTIEGPWSEGPTMQYGCPRPSLRDLERVVQVERGDLLTGRLPRQVKRRVREFLQQYGFQAPRVKVEYEAEGEVLTVAVKVTQCFSINFLEREESQSFGGGFERVMEPELYAALPFRESGVFDLREAQLGIDELLAYYRTRGYLFADVQMHYVDYRQMQPGWDYPLLGGVTYRVTRGQPAEIRELLFPGLRRVPAEELLALMDTRRYDFFDVGGYLEVEQLFSDLDVIKKHFLDRGYFDMTFSRALNRDDQVRVQLVREAERTIYRYHYLDKAFDVVKNDWENAIRVEIAIDEGEGSRVGELELGGVTSLPMAELRARLPLIPGGEFSARLVRLAERTIEERYQQSGRQVTVDVACRGRSPELPREECTVDQVRSLEVDLFLTVTEGEQQLMGEVLVVGNLKTSRSAIVRDFPRLGEPYDRARIDEAVRRLRNLGVFSSVRLVPIGMDELPPRRRIDVVVQVEEAGTRSIDFSAGFQKMYDRTGRGQEEPMAPGIRDLLSTSIHLTGASLTGAAAPHRLQLPDVLLLGEAGYTDRNFLGRAKSLQIPVSYGLTTTDPARYAAFKPTYFDSRFFATSINMRLTPLVVYDRALSRVDKFEYGIENELSYPILKRLNLSLTTRVTRTAWKYPDDPDFGPQEWESSLTPALRLDWRDNPIHPTSGFYLMGRVKYLNAYELVASKGADETTSWSNERENFFQYELQGQAYLSVRKSLILAFNARYGHTYAFGGGDGKALRRLPPTHSFYLGGTTGVRGFPARGVLQYDHEGEPRLQRNPGTNEWEVVEGGGSMINGSVELRFPLLRAMGFWGAVFLDSGAVSPDLGEYLHGKSFRFATGLGIRWLIGEQIPLRLDYGFVLDPRCNAVDPVSGECVANDAPGALDFGLLYTF